MRLELLITRQRMIFLPQSVDKLQNAGMAGISAEKCSPWNTFVERQSTAISICGQLFLGKALRPGG
jgi:hypothetical protein